ncbi:TPR repeat containing exported protein [Sphingopyxis granuli]|uniref:TPR repeat containing exported protein n=2 Tax=Sphingopyxis granuli TaxID=267128 RepID=A0AA86GKB9_9SPHN|nr:TPR repeat containing exported protein [Sphingopyxis granuli]
MGAYRQMKMRHISFLATAAITLSASVPALAQDAGIDKRVERLEKEMRAVQRSVFPGGSPAFFEGEIAPDNTPGERVKSSAPVIDLTARVDALEAQLQTLTGQTEQNAFQLRELEKKFNAYKAETDKRLAAPEASEVTGTPASLAPTVKPPATVATTAAATPAKKPATTKPAATTPDATRLALVKKVEIPATGNEVEDSYNYGYRLWEAKLYPEAEAQLKQVVTKWPNHRLASYAQNLLGRAYLDEGKPSLAAVAFYNNYKDRPSGARAPHSLMYMGVALEKLGRKADACKAFRELDEVYGDKAPKDVRDDAAAAKAKTGC